ncbi:MAG: NYN domain-containing protein [Actinobacteria bacterium]|nr:NYN domain-containing protein [Actinomycetota bacterium]
MKDLIIVDGYNFIFNFYRAGKLKARDIEHLKDQLVSDLSAYGSQKKCSITVVFDAKGGSSRLRSSTTVDNVKVIHSRKSETADTIIEELVKDQSDQRNVLVVTSDYTQQKVIFGKNTTRKSSREFSIEINSVKKSIRQLVMENKKRSEKGFYPLENRLDPDIRKKISDLRKK